MLTVRDSFWRTGLAVLIVWGLTACGNVSVKPSPGAALTLDNLNDSEQSMYEQALQHMETGNTQRAAQTLESLAGTQPRVREIWLNLALLQYRQDDLTQAEATVNRILQRWKATAPAHNLAGLIAMRKGEFERAKTHYSEALTLNPQYVNALYNMALLLDVYLQDIPGAVHFYQQYLNLAEHDDTTRAWMEELRFSLNRSAEL